MKKNGPLVSVIVTNYNGKKYLGSCLDSLMSQTYKNIEIIVADDCSTDDSVEFVKKNFPKVKIAVNERNSGLSINSNNGAKKALGRYIIFYNNDTISFPNFIEEMVKIAESNENIGVVCPIQLPYKEEDDKNMTRDQKDVGVGSDIYGEVCTAWLAGHVFYPDAAIFIRADLFRRIGGFDQNFFLYGEDMDLCWRVHLMGYIIKPALNAKFRHDSSCFTRENGKVVTTYKRRHFVERQNINKMLKYYKISTLVWILPKFAFFYALESLFFLVVLSNPKAFWEIYVKSVLWNIRNFPSTLENRRYIQKIREVDDKYILSLMYHRYSKIKAVRELGLPIIK